MAINYQPIPVQFDGMASLLLDSLIRGTVRPDNFSSPLSKRGVVPVGTPVLHSRTADIKVISRGLSDFAHHMLMVMEQADGIGLAANQTGVSLQILVHKLALAAPPVMINPVILGQRGKWTYEEGCLSLKVEGTVAEVIRPKVITVVATLLDGRVLVVRADELLARVIQHEIDHLDGIEYVQRLHGELQESVYERIKLAGIDLSYIPLMPYGEPLVL